MYASCHVIRSLSRDPLDYVRLTIDITLDYGISGRGEIGTLWHASAGVWKLLAIIEVVDVLIIIRVTDNQSADDRIFSVIIFASPSTTT